ncbi:hypothetical protein ACFONG_16195 [Uliginosibacterium paludis]|uniref:Uncharacterized protein n=1 Tax=Uliginosibacterium paludis TaxID=1615952 RepID=A0ABV2CUD0_9RHOO
MQFLGFVIAAVLLEFSKFAPKIDVRPFPLAASARVRLELPVRFAGDYRIEVSTPKVDGNFRLNEKSFPCDILFTVQDGDNQIISRHADSISTASEVGWANTQTFVAGDNFRLGHGTYYVTITSGGACPIASARGASITVSRFEREHILGSLLIDLLAVLLLVSGVVGLLRPGFFRSPNNSIPGTASKLASTDLKR